MADRNFTEHLRGALAALESEHPPLYARMVAALGDREVLLVVDGERVSLRFDRGEPLAAVAEAACVTCVTTRGVILELVAGAISVEDAIRGDRILLRGALGDLVAFHDGLMAYLHGAVRSPSFPERLRAFRGACEERPAKEHVRAPSPRGSAA